MGYYESMQPLRLDILGNLMLERVQNNIGNIIFIIFAIIVFLAIKFLLQSEIKGNCPYCGVEVILNKQHHDKLCVDCGNEFRIRHARIYKGEDKADELLYYITKALGYLVVLSGNRVKEQDAYFEDFVLSQGVTRNQFNDVKIIYENCVKGTILIKFLYRDVIDKLKLYVEEYFASQQIIEMENNENTILSILYNFANINGKLNEEENKFFKYFRKMFHMNEARFNMVINNLYESRHTSNNYNQSKSKTSESDTGYRHANSYQNKQENEYNTSNREYYKILECDSNISDDELKKQYKKLMMQYHPDKYASSDLPEEIEKMLNTKMSELNNAYEHIKKERGIN